MTTNLFIELQKELIKRLPHMRTDELVNLCPFFHFGDLSIESKVKAKIESEPAKIESEPAKIESEPAKIESEPAKIESEPAKIESEPAKIESELSEKDLLIEEVIDLGGESELNEMKRKTTGLLTKLRDKLKSPRLPEPPRFDETETEEPDSHDVEFNNIVTRTAEMIHDINAHKDFDKDRRWVYNMLSELDDGVESIQELSLENLKILFNNIVDLVLDEWQLDFSDEKLNSWGVEFE